MHNHADAFAEFVGEREELALQNNAFTTTASLSAAAPASSGGQKSFERKVANFMAVKAGGKGLPAPQEGGPPDHPWARPCIVEECQEEHAATACTLFKSKSPEDRLAIVMKRELCTLYFRHLDTKRCWSLGKVTSCRVKGCTLAHSSLLHDILQNE
jgi:hypothetical protein